ncbi:hypothetical protein BO99DRAFT_463719 [Aspergillus violaceofuscus CBS 115571]|uniref:Uncharacterized protein n=1 Tax=Aspergillus violaceofuscus (strain CBS 115571) TaxID=1450538 RepID=A0A2V5IC73_ASPV1|nr:hypothetical protein BO99DRAFT_463719 [Aspergillus violaceofuscus CBS 115571]
MWRHFGCQNPINSLDLVIPRSLPEQAVQVLRKANFDDGCRLIENIRLWKDQEYNYEAAPCNFIYNLRANFHRTCHEDWFPTVELPACGPLAEDDETHLVSTDTRLASCQQATYEVKMFQPARMVEALIRLAFRDYYLYGPQHLDYISLSDSCMWVEQLSNIFSSLIPEKEEDGTATAAAAAAAAAEEPRSGAPPPWARARVNKAFTKAPELTLRGLDPRWLRLEDFHGPWFYYLQMTNMIKDGGVYPTPQRILDLHIFRRAFQVCSCYHILCTLAWVLERNGVFPEDISPFPMKSILAWQSLTDRFPHLKEKSDEARRIDEWLTPQEYKNAIRWRRRDYPWNLDGSQPRYEPHLAAAGNT